MQQSPATEQTRQVERALEARLGAQRHATVIQWLAVAGALLCILASAGLQAPINQQRKELQLVTQSNIYQSLPPKYALATAIGGPFRGPAILFLWMRHEKLKEEGKYFESHQLAKWICTLQPRFPAVWSFQSWNMSYNISVATHTAQERWQWVYNGIRLLRDEGIPNNPRIVPLYHQLAWTWFHKVGDRSDDFQWYYKRRWAAIMETLLGAPPAGKSNAETIDWFRPVAVAPRELSTVIAEHPGVAQIVEQLNQLGVDCEVGTGIERVMHPLEDSLFRSYTLYTREQQLAPLRSSAPPAASNERDDALKRLWPAFQQAAPEDLDALLAHLRAKVLREQYKMDPQYMLQLTGEFGTDEPIPIDWRTPWSQSLYWSKYGVDKAASELRDVKEFDILNTDRIQLFSLATLSKEGRYTFRMNMNDTFNSFLAVAPDLRFIEAMHRKYLEMGKKHAESGEEVGETAGDTLRSGHVNNLESAIVALYLGAKKDDAARYLEYLAVNYKTLYTHETQARYTQGLDEFVYSQLKEMLGSYKDANFGILSLLLSAEGALADGWQDEYAAAVQNAALLYQEYQKDHAKDQKGRLTLLPFAELRSIALAQFVLAREYPVVYRSLAWNREQEEVRQGAYDFILQDLPAQCEAVGLDFAKAFPEPVGMAQYRKDHPPKNPEQVSEENKKSHEAAQQND